MLEVYKMVGRVMDSEATVLIIGETGTGKEIGARAIHFNRLLNERQGGSRCVVS